MSEKADLLYMFCIEKRKEAKRSEKNTQNKARKQPACPENDYSGGQARKPSKEVRVPTVSGYACLRRYVRPLENEYFHGTSRGGRRPRAERRSRRASRRARRTEGQRRARPRGRPRGPGRRLSPGCRAVELVSSDSVEALSRYCRGAVEALPVEPVEILSSSCRACRA